jgi:cob(I)alamin adenosyltransferase
MKIYTKTGDKGKTSLYTGERIEKSDHIFDALGSIDEVNAYLGLVKMHCVIFLNLGKRALCRH